VTRAVAPFEIAALGALSHDFELASPAEPGAYVLEATATTPEGSRTVSRRKVTIAAP
jgi:hypothetical protein